MQKRVTKSETKFNRLTNLGHIYRFLSLISCFIWNPTHIHQLIERLSSSWRVVAHEFIHEGFLSCCSLLMLYLSNHIYNSIYYNIITLTEYKFVNL